MKIFTIFLYARRKKNIDELNFVQRSSDVKNVNAYEQKKLLGFGLRRSHEMRFIEIIWFWFIIRKCEQIIIEYACHWGQRNCWPQYFNKYTTIYLDTSTVEWQMVLENILLFSTSNCKFRKFSPFRIVSI